MASFSGDLTVTQIGGTWRLWRLEEPLIYSAGSDDVIRVIMVPRGFVTDGPSIPRALWAILPVWGSWSRAGVVHDYLCCLISIGHPHRLAPTRLDADRMFREAMVSLGVGSIAKRLLYCGVRIGTLLGVKTEMADRNAAMHAALIEAADSAE